MTSERRTPRIRFTCSGLRYVHPSWRSRSSAGIWLVTSSLVGGVWSGIRTSSCTSGMDGLRFAGDGDGELASQELLHEAASLRLVVCSKFGQGRQFPVERSDYITDFSLLFYSRHGHQCLRHNGPAR